MQTRTRSPKTDCEVSRRPSRKRGDSIGNRSTFFEFVGECSYSWCQAHLANPVTTNPAEGVGFTVLSCLFSFFLQIFAGSGSLARILQVLSARYLRCYSYFTVFVKGLTSLQASLNFMGLKPETLNPHYCFSLRF